VSIAKREKDSKYESPKVASALGVLVTWGQVTGTRGLLFVYIFLRNVCVSRSFPSLTHSPLDASFRASGEEPARMSHDGKAASSATPHVELRF
jgi:hypothetical protein